MSPRWFLVTGTSRGIGRATALRLAASGGHVIATARNPADDGSLAEQGRGRITVVELDLEQDRSIETLAAHVADVVGTDGLAGIINNAASSDPGCPIEFVTRKHLETEFAVNAIGTTLLTTAVMPSLRLATGRIVNVAIGQLPLSPMGPHHAARQAMETLSSYLRIETRPIGVSVSVVYPGMTRWSDVDAQLQHYADGLDAAIVGIPPRDRVRFASSIETSKRLHRRMMRTAAPADKVAATIERALTARRPRARYYCGWEQVVSAGLQRLTTERATERIASRITGLR